MARNYSINEGGIPLETLILRLAMACETGDKELEIFSDALSEAIEQIKNNPVAIATVAQAVRDCMGDDIGLASDDSDIKAIHLLCKPKEVESFHIEFDLIEASAKQEVVIIDDRYDKKSIIDGLCRGSLMTTTWFERGGSQAIETCDKGELVAEILNQEISSEYTNFKQG